MKLESIGQVALVVKDVEASSDYLLKQFGIGPFGIMDFDNGRAVSEGKEIRFNIRVGICDLNGINIEMVQVIEGDFILSDPTYLPPGGLGIHHIGFFVDDAESLAAQWEVQGGKILQRVYPIPEALTIYLDTPQYAGMLVELIQIG